MFSARFRSNLGLALLLGCCAWSGTVARAAGPPPPPPLPAALPAIYAETAAGTDTARFHFVDAIVGTHFKPGEKVTVQAQGIGLAPLTATADENGSFSVTFHYTLVFCGSGGTSHPAPVYVAHGDRGSSAHYGVPTPLCPLLRSTALHTPAAGSHPFVALRRTELAVQGFGFVPGEQIALREDGPKLYRSTGATRVKADVRGRVTAMLVVTVPPTCRPLDRGPYLQGSGSSGTAVLAPIGWTDPARASCQNLSPPPITEAPPTYLATAGHNASVHVVPVYVAPGGTQAAVVRGDEPATPVFTVRYSNGVSVQQSSPLGADMRHTFRWRVPAGARGNATLSVNFGHQEPVLHASLNVASSAATR